MKTSCSTSLFLFVA